MYASTRRRFKPKCCYVAFFRYPHTPCMPPHTWWYSTLSLKNYHIQLLCCWFEWLKRIFRSEFFNLRETRCDTHLSLISYVEDIFVTFLWFRRARAHDVVSICKIFSFQSLMISSRTRYSFRIIFGWIFHHVFLGFELKINKIFHPSFGFNVRERKLRSLKYSTCATLEICWAHTTQSRKSFEWSTRNLTKVKLQETKFKIQSNHQVFLIIVGEILSFSFTFLCKFRIPFSRIFLVSKYEHWNRIKELKLRIMASHRTCCRVDFGVEELNFYRNWLWKLQKSNRKNFLLLDLLETTSWKNLSRATRDSSPAQKQRKHAAIKYD